MIRVGEETESLVRGRSSRRLRPAGLAGHKPLQRAFAGWRGGGGSKAHVRELKKKISVTIGGACVCSLHFSPSGGAHSPCNQGGENFLSFRAF